MKKYRKMTFSFLRKLANGVWWLAFCSCYNVSAAFAEADGEELTDGLGGSREIVEKLQIINPVVTVAAIQNEFFPRSGRWELASQLSYGLGGDTYVRSHSVGFNGYYHINRYFSLGISWQKVYNFLTPEGEQSIAQAIQEYYADPSDPSRAFPEVNYLKEAGHFSFLWYPIYGKISWLSSKIIQFNSYLALGFGNLSLRFHNANSTQVGLGFSFWVTPKWTIRTEVLWHFFEARYHNQLSPMNWVLLGTQLGYIF
ncbi:MAG: outer membrane beta-barrel domain-containing protein [Bdellovibrionaceae bacterium]|nr:outer membrane beta-barrel domain-containing protein [Pseudobdellovibrionaceae bacterium]MDW8189419.1 outer membrane beta-barrel domain-containing protein [Pseudobdellovibrionaceae bacterium]